MKHTGTLIIIFCTIILSACGVKRKTVTATVPDSAPDANREQLSTLNNPGPVENDTFIRNIDKNDNKDLALTIKAPEKPKPVIMAYDTMQAFAVQLKAFGEEAPARALVAQLSQVEPDSVFYFEDGYLFKVRIGPYFNRSDADKKKLTYKQGSFTGAWVAPHLVIKSHIVDERSPADKKPSTPKTETVQSNDAPAKGIYIQIAAAKSRINAEQFVNRNKNVSGFSPQIISDGMRFKIAIGPFANRKDAEKLLPDIRSQFPGAWLISR